MARYADYANTNQIDQELEQTQQVVKRNIPDSVLKRFDGKTVDDVLESYAHLERSYSQQGQEIGTLRKTVDDLVQITASNSNSSRQDTAKPVEPITVDDLYKDPNAAINRLVDSKVQDSTKRVEQLESELQRLRVESGLKDLTNKYPEWRADAQSPEFLDWARSSPAFSTLAVQADKGDLNAANSLFDLWYGHKQIEQKVQERVSRESTFRNATLETSSPGSVQGDPVISRHTLQERRRAAKLGDRKAQRWLAANAESIAIAYEEGRIVD